MFAGIEHVGFNWLTVAAPESTALCLDIVPLLRATIYRAT
jgi:hypothetical protein